MASQGSSIFGSSFGYYDDLNVGDSITANTVTAVTGNFTNITGTVTPGQLLVQHSETTNDNKTLVVGNAGSSLATNSSGVHVGYNGTNQVGSIYSMNNSGTITDLYLNNTTSYGLGTVHVGGLETDNISEQTSGHGVEINSGLTLSASGITAPSGNLNVNVASGDLNLQSASTTAIQIGGSVIAIQQPMNFTGANPNIPTTTSSVGQIWQNGSPILHSYGTNNMFIGTSMGNFTNSASNAFGIGHGCLGSLTSGTSNFAAGNGALANVTTGSYNVGIGLGAGANNISGNFNVAIGQYAMGSSSGGTGSENFALGASSLRLLTSGIRNVCIGDGAGYSLVTGSSNICVGYLAGQGYTAGETNNICLGYGNSGVGGESNTVRIESSTPYQTVIMQGIYGTSLGSSATLMGITSGLQLGTGATTLTTSANLNTSGQYNIAGNTALSATNLYLYSSGAVASSITSNSSNPNTYTLPSKTTGTYTIATTVDKPAVFAMNSASTPANGYFFQYNGLTNTESYAQIVVTRSGILQNLTVSAYTSPGTSTWTFTIRQNGSGTAVAVSLTGSATTGNSGSNYIAVNQYDLISCQYTTNSGNPISNVIVSWEIL